MRVLQADLMVLRFIFPDVKDIFHINGKFVICPNVENGEWVLGEFMRQTLDAHKFTWYISDNKIWIHDRPRD